MSLWRKAGSLAYALGWPLLWVYLRIGARTRVLVVADGQVLLVQNWLGDDKWGLPGGGLRRHENLTKGAAREVTEETGIPLLPDQCKLLASEWRVRDSLKFYCHFLVATLPAPIVPQKQRGEIVGAGWFALDKLHDLPRKAEIDRALELWAAH